MCNLFRKDLFVVDGHIHVDDAKNREDLAIETDKQKRKQLTVFSNMSTTTKKMHSD